MKSQSIRRPSMVAGLLFCSGSRTSLSALRVSHRSSACTGTSMPPTPRETRTSPCRSGSALDGSPVNTRELSGIAEVLAAAGRDEAVSFASPLARREPAEAAAILATLRIRQGRFEEASLLVQDSLTRYRATPWPQREVMWRGIRSAALVAEADRAQAPRMAALLDQPFAARLNDQQRAIERIHAA